MQTVRVAFDDVLHVHRNRASRTAPEHTVFSFMSQFNYTPYVTVPGSPRIEPGMSVLALLRNPEDWKSLVGWLDLKTGELAAPKPNWHLHRLLFLSSWLLVASAFMGHEALQLQFPQALLWALFASFWAVFFRSEYKAWRQAQSDRKSLQSLAAANDA